MVNKIRLVLGHNTGSINSTDIFIADHKNYKDGFNIEITSIAPIIPAVRLHNPNEIPIAYDCFPENAFPKLTDEGEVIQGDCYCQCECVLFPVSVSLKVATDSQEKCFHYIAN